jgi:hypothetical protein
MSETTMTTLPLSPKVVLELKLYAQIVHAAQLQIELARLQAQGLLRELLLRAGEDPEHVKEWDVNLDTGVLSRGSNPTPDPAHDIEQRNELDR